MLGSHRPERPHTGFSRNQVKLVVARGSFNPRRYGNHRAGSLGPLLRDQEEWQVKFVAAWAYCRNDEDENAAIKEGRTRLRASRRSVGVVR